MIHPVQMGKRTRMSFSRVEESLDMPDLIEVQKNSYERFLSEDLMEVLRDSSPITDYAKNLELSFTGYTLDREHPKYTIERCRERDLTYSAQLKVNVSLYNKTNGSITESEVFMGDFPLMTENGTFVINGAERVIVSQLVRSPGAYYVVTIDKAGKSLYSATLIPNRGAWLEYEPDANDVLWVRVDRARKLPMTVLLRAIGFPTNNDIINAIGETEQLRNTFEKDTTDTTDKALLEIYKKQRPGEPLSVDSARTLLHTLLFDPRRYDLARVGRYKFNKKLDIAQRLIGHKAAADVMDPETGEILVEAGDLITREIAADISAKGINTVDIAVEKQIDGHIIEQVIRVVGNNFVDASNYLDFDPAEVGINEKVHYPTLMALIAECKDKGWDLRDTLRENLSVLIPKHIIVDDILASASYQLGLPYGVGRTDDIDHLGNRRMRSVGELLQNQIRVGMAKLERMVKERMAVQDSDTVRPQDLINIRPVSAAIKEFFGSSQLSQFMDQPNPLAELTHKRRLSALGPGGLNRDRASFEVRDVHYSHYARICPIETPEGPNIGLIGSLATYARINEYGFIEAPYRKVDKTVEPHVVTGQIDYMTADEEDNYVVAQANEPLNEDGSFKHARCNVRIREEIIEHDSSDVDYVDVSPRQIVSVATAMIPFLENDDATRALMGSNMQRQAVPLLRPQAPIVGTGMEYKAAHDSGVAILAKQNGTIEYVSADRIILREDDTNEPYTYNLIKFARSNQGTCINQRPVVQKGEHVVKGDTIADGPSTDQGEIALGRNVLIGFMTWEGYNYEDAVLLSEKLVMEDAYTSIHIEEYESEARDTKLGPEEITSDIPNIGVDALKDLDEEGIIRIGAEVRSGDILVGKVTPKGETELTAEERLLRAIFGEKAREVRDTSLRVPHGEAGTIVDVKVFTKENHDELSPGVNKMVRVYIAQKRKISVGDKMAGRHGNKGVVSRILPEEDMPFLPDGTPLQIVLNPLGVPSRMNIGQVLEVHLGRAAKALGWHVATPVFDGANFEEIQECLTKAGLDPSGKSDVYDGRTGDKMENQVTVGYIYFLKLHHLVDDKIHARSNGPYSLITQQPLGGKAQFGGQRFGEMEVWALEAYGAANVLQEILTVKSDDVMGRVATYEAIVKGNNIPAPGVPESFKVLVKELQALALDIKVLNDQGEEIVIRELEDEDMDTSAPLDVNMSGQEDVPDFIPQSLTDELANSDVSTMHIDELDEDFDDTFADAPSDVSYDDEEELRMDDDEPSEDDLKKVEDEDFDIFGTDSDFGMPDLGADFGFADDNDPSDEDN